MHRSDAPGKNLFGDDFSSKATRDGTREGEAGITPDDALDYDDSDDDASSDDASSDGISETKIADPHGAEHSNPESPNPESPEAGSRAGSREEKRPEGSSAEAIVPAEESTSSMAVHIEPMPTTGVGVRPLHEPRPQEGPATLFSGVVPTKVRQPHWCLRRRNFWGEQRALWANEGKRPTSGSVLSVRLSPVQRQLLKECVSHSTYHSKSAYLRATVTGRDRSAPILAKAGAVLVWARCFLGQKIKCDQWAALGRLTQFLFSTEEINPKEIGPEDISNKTAENGTIDKEEIAAALRLVEKHLLARHLFATDGGSVPRVALQPALRGSAAKETGKRVEKEVQEEERLEVLRGLIQLSEHEEDTITTFRMCHQRKAVVEENRRHSDYRTTSTYIRHMALGWDREGQVVSQCAATARWVAACLREYGPQNDVHPYHWNELEACMQEHFDLFLFGSRGEADVDGALRRGAEHLLGTRLETIAEETGLSSEQSSS